MRILIDTNIFIYREDYKTIPKNVTRLFKVLNHLKVEIVLHPGSIEDIRRDPNEKRKEIILSKIDTYTILESPPNPDRDEKFTDVLGNALKINDKIDNLILYAIYKDAADFLITNDDGIHQKSKRIDVKDRVLSVDEALNIFADRISKNQTSHLPAMKDDFVYNLNINDPFFNSLKEEYGNDDFKNWFKKISREGRKCFVHFNNNKEIGALLIYKIESETIDSTPILPLKKRLKLSTFKVSYVGNKIGELFIKLAVEYAIQNKVYEIYLTHYENENQLDFLTNLITEFGFKREARLNKTGESLFLKKLLRDEEDKITDPSVLSKVYYPSYYDGLEVNKFIVPIVPKWHDKLFIEYRGMNRKWRQPIIPEFDGEFIVEGNTIEKAYICKSKTKKVAKGDVLLFYRSQDQKAITSLGIVEKVFHGIRNKDEVIRSVMKRSVYSLPDIDEMEGKISLVVLFRWHFHLPNSLTLEELKEIGVLKGPPQSLTQISHENYIIVKKRGLIDERFTINKTTLC
jgi:hypothetical protein